MDNLVNSGKKRILFSNTANNINTSVGSVLSLTEPITSFDIVIAEFVCSDGFIHGFLYGREITQNPNNSNCYCFTSSKNSGGFYFDIIPHYGSNDIEVKNSNMSWLRIIYAYNFTK